MHEQFELRQIQTNGVELRIAEKGDGPLVVLVHGWPELWYSWRHQIGPLAAAGYRVVAPDVRGYGGSAKPHPVEAYAMTELMADLTGLIDALGEEKAILVGHDWGAPICWNTAALRPDKVAAIAALSVPYRKRTAVSQIDIWQKIYAGKFFYQVYFQDEGTVEAEVEADMRTALRKIYYSISGDAPSLDSWLDRHAEGGLLDAMVDPDPFPSWMTPADMDYFVSAFEAGGFRGPINRYRNQRRDFENLPDMNAAPVQQPSCFIAGEKDVVRRFVPGRDVYEGIEENCTDFRFKRIIPGAGHWVQQEAPAAVNEALLEFLAGL
ncbi:MAG: alpha/beta fold hydrolase [Hyphomicrobiaceae bacterium]